MVSRVFCEFDPRSLLHAQVQSTSKWSASQRSPQIDIGSTFPTAPQTCRPRKTFSICPFSFSYLSGLGWSEAIPLVVGNIHQNRTLRNFLLLPPIPQLQVLATGLLKNWTFKSRVSSFCPSQSSNVDWKPVLDTPRIDIDQTGWIIVSERSPLKKKTHAEKSKHHELDCLVSEIPVIDFERVGNSSPTPGLGLAYLDESLAALFTPIPSELSPSIYSTPFGSPSLSPDSTPVSPVLISIENLAIDCIQGHFNRIDIQTPPKSVSIGELGKRRGFKGAPLLTPAINKKPSYLSLPCASSPRATLRQISNPRSPLATVTNLIRTGTPKSSKFSPVTLIPSDYEEVSQQEQDSYDEFDPLGTWVDSYFAPDVISVVEPSSNLDDFEPYGISGLPTANAPFRDAWKQAPLIRRTMRTTIYDTSIYDVPETTRIRRPRESQFNSPKVQTRQTRRAHNSMDITVIPPSAPSSPVLAEITIPDLVDNAPAQHLSTKRKCPRVQPSSFEIAALSCSPVLPLRITKRRNSTLVSSQTAPCLNRHTNAAAISESVRPPPVVDSKSTATCSSSRTRGVKALDDIISMLDDYDLDFEQQKDDALDGHWGNTSRMSTSFTVCAM